MTSLLEPRLCRATTKSGKACKGKCYVTSTGRVLPTCYFHTAAGVDAGLDAEKLDNRRRGGSRGKHDLTPKLRRALAASKGQGPDAVIAILSTTLTALVTDQVPPRSAMAISSVASTLLRALELRDVSGRVAALEKLATGGAGPPTLQAAVLAAAGQGGDG